jgi:hypothetical protein
MRPPCSHDGMKFDVFDDARRAVALGDPFDNTTPKSYE